VRHPGPRGQPADLLELVDRAAAEPLEAVLVLVAVFGARTLLGIGSTDD